MISQDINQAKQLLEEKELIAIPTETVYGLAGNAWEEEAIKKIFELKKRPLKNPLIVHISSLDKLDQVAYDIPQAAYQLAKRFWPGPLTLVLKKLPHISNLITAGKDTVAVRVPNHPLTLSLLNQLDFPLVAPSANPFGSISPTSSPHVEKYFKNDLPLILEGGECEKGIESTIVGFDEESRAIIYRLGSLSMEEIESCIGKVNLLNHNDQNPEAPGMLSKHYSPKTPLIVSEDMENSLLSFHDKAIGLLLFKKANKNNPNLIQEILSPTGNLSEAAKNLYAAMHRLDQKGLSLIIAEKLPNEGIGIVLNDRLARASKFE